MFTFCAATFCSNTDIPSALGVSTIVSVPSTVGIPAIAGVHAVFSIHAVAGCFACCRGPPVVDITSVPGVSIDVGISSVLASLLFLHPCYGWHP
jgi:hypothetical protein